jgi:hypothetical protein
MAFLKHPWNTCHVPQNCYNPITWEGVQLCKFFFQNNQIVFERELSILLDSSKENVQFLYPLWQRNRRRVKCVLEDAESWLFPLTYRVFHCLNF